LYPFFHGIWQRKHLLSTSYFYRYEQSLSVLKHAKNCKEGMITKSSIMLGLGETDEEVRQAMTDLRAIGVDILTLGQYLQVSPVPAFDFGAACVSIVSSYKPNYLMLQPTDKHLTVREYVPPEKFQFWKEYGESIGFRYVASGPLVSTTCRRLLLHTTGL
jgi:lipoic acid synthetase